MVMVNFFLTIDHGVNSRVSWSWSVPYPPPPKFIVKKFMMKKFMMKKFMMKKLLFKLLRHDFVFITMTTQRHMCIFVGLEKVFASLRSKNSIKLWHFKQKSEPCESSYITRSFKEYIINSSH